MFNDSKCKLSKQQHILIKKPYLGSSYLLPYFKIGGGGGGGEGVSKKLPCSSIHVRLMILGKTSEKVKQGQKQNRAHVWLVGWLCFLVGSFIAFLLNILSICISISYLLLEL